MMKGTGTCHMVGTPGASSTKTAFRPCVALAELDAYGGSSQEALHHPNRLKAAKLDWNESVHTPSPEVRRALVDHITHDQLNWYPDVESVALRSALSNYAGVGVDWIRVFGGSDAALEYVARAFVEPGDHILWCPPTYDNFRVYVQSCGGRLVGAYLSSIWSPDPDGILASVTSKTRLIYIVNPNNPTGALYSVEQIDALLRAHSDIGFIVDEAYYEFAGVTAASLLEEHANLMVVRSFSKAFGLAGLRVGYVLSHPRNLAWLDRIRVGKNTNVLGQVAALAVLRDRDHLRKTVSETRAAMRALTSNLAALGLEVRTTPANFIMVRVHDPDAVCRRLADRLIFVRNRDHAPGLSGYVRITVGTPEIVTRVTEAFAGIPREKLLGGRSAVTDPTPQRWSQAHTALDPTARPRGMRRGTPSTPDECPEFVDVTSEHEAIGGHAR